MGAAVNEVLWPQRHLWLKANTGNAITTKAGSGQATYFKPHRSGDTIVFGKKMVASKCTVFAERWLSYRELVRFDYFKGEASPLNLLAHTVCHEFAHYLQAHFKQRRRGEVHNRDFYRYLDEIHERGLADQVKQFLTKAGLRLSEVPIVEQEGIRVAPISAPVFKVGDTIHFNYKGERIAATVMRINRKTVSAKALAGRVRTRQAYWRVPFRLIDGAK